MSNKIADTSRLEILAQDRTCGRQCHQERKLAVPQLSYSVPIHARLLKSAVEVRRILDMLRQFHAQVSRSRDSKHDVQEVLD